MNIATATCQKCGWTVYAEYATASEACPHCHTVGTLMLSKDNNCTAISTQVGGDHYKSMKIQPIEFAVANNLDFFQKDIVKYVTRRKGGKEKRLEDLRKASHYIDLYIEFIEKGEWE